MSENIYIGGFMGTGKSTVGKILASRLHRPFLDTDSLVEKRHGRSIALIFEESGEPAFRESEARTVREVLALQGCVVALGGGVLENLSLREALAASGRLVVLEASAKEILRRLGEKGKSLRPLLDPSGMEELLRKRAPGYGAGNFRIATESKTPEGVAEEVMKVLGEAPQRVFAGNRRILEARGEGYDYSVIIGPGVLEDPEVWKALEMPPSLVVGDAITLPLWEAKLPFRKPLHALPRGEEAKSPDSLLKMYGALLEKGVHRGDFLVALGGGTVGDAAGFAAASWMRGIDYVQCPTTLLSQIDSALGGKTGINLPEGKNLVGAFHHPRLVVADVLTLTTLGDAEFRQGLGEAVKYGLGEDAELFSWLWEHGEEILRRDPEVLTELVAWCGACKLGIVAEDTREANSRMRLNLGHTLGHALESASSYRQWRHGDAVGVGMRIVTRIARKMGYCSGEDEERLESLLRFFGLPLRPDRPWNEIAPYLERDKKIRRGILPLVIPRHERPSVISAEIPRELVRESYEELRI